MPLALLAACAGLFGFFAPLTAGASLMAGDGGVASCGVSPMATWWSLAPMAHVALRAPRRPRRRAGRVLSVGGAIDAVVVVVLLGGRGAAHSPNAKKMEKFGAERRGPARAPPRGPYCD